MLVVLADEKLMPDLRRRYLAVQCLQFRMPFLCRMRPVGAKGDAQRAVVDCAAFVWRAGEDINLVGDVKIDKPGHYNGHV